MKSIIIIRLLALLVIFWKNAWQCGLWNVIHNLYTASGFI